MRHDREILRKDITKTRIYVKEGSVEGDDRLMTDKRHREYLGVRNLKSNIKEI